MPQQQKNQKQQQLQQQQQQIQTIEELQAKCLSDRLPFWIWSEGEKHKPNEKGDCCFNDLIGRPLKDGKEMPLYDYEYEIYHWLLESKDERTRKRVWIKKATGLGVTEFMLRLMIWLCLRYPLQYINSQMCIVTGPNIDIAIKLIKRMKALFFRKLGIQFDNKETVIQIGSCTIEAYPSNHLDAYRSLENPKFIFLDEADFFRKDQQEDARTVTERYIGKSDPHIAMVSTPNKPDGLFARLEVEKDELCIYHKLCLGYQVGLDKIYSKEDIAQARRSPSFEREYNLKYLGSIGNVFATEDIDYAISHDYHTIEYLDDFSNPPRLQGIMGVDPGWGSSNFGIVVTHFVDGIIRVAYVNQFTRSDHSEMVNEVWQLIQRFNVTKVLVDASAPSFIRALKLQWGERSDYENVDKELRDYMKVEPVSFGVEHKQLLYHAKFLLENKYLQIHPSFDKLITALRSAWAKDGVLDKEVTSYDDILDALRLCLRPYREKSE
jgi:Terminase RNaseH-like domain